MSKNFLTATLAGGVPLFALHFLVYVLPLPDFFDNGAISPEPTWRSACRSTYGTMVGHDHDRRRRALLDSEQY